MIIWGKNCSYWWRNGKFHAAFWIEKYTHSITALVNMVDDGGSTGVLRDELGRVAGGRRQAMSGGAKYFAESSRFIQLPIWRGQY